MDKLWYIQKMKYYSAMKRNELSRHKKDKRNLKCILLRKEGSLKCYILDNSNYMTLWKRSNYGDSKEISG